MVVNARLITLTDGPPAQALGMRDGIITALGATADVMACAGESTRVLDAHGAVVVPGLVDGHAHLDREGLREAYPSMTGLRTVDAVLDRIAALTAAAGDGEWVVTMPLGHPPYYEGQQPFPTRLQLDAVTPRNPVFIRPIWGYWRHTQPLTSVMNTRALDLLGADRIRLCGEWADFEREVSGELTGRVHERTFEPTVEFLLPRAAGRFSADMRDRALRRSAQIYHATGTTGVYEGHGASDEVRAAYRRVAATSGLAMRARLPLSLPWAGSTPEERARLRAVHVSAVAANGAGDDMLRFVGLALGSVHHSPGIEVRRAARPYTGWAGFDPDAQLEGADLVAELISCARAGVQVASMTPDLLDVFEQVDRCVPLRGLRWVLGHVNDIERNDIERIRRLGLVVTTHTNRYIYKEGQRTQARGRVPVPLRSLVLAGVPVSLGTDNVPTSLFAPIWHAVARESRDGPLASRDECLSRVVALRAASVGGAYLTGDEHRRGTLAPGMQADLAVLSDDVLRTTLSQIPSIHAVATIVDGKVVHDPEGLTG